MSLLSAGEMKKGTDPSGTAVKTFVDGSSRHYQGIVRCDKYGNIVGTSAAASAEPTKVTILASATNPTKILDVNEARQSIYLFFLGGTLLLGFNSRSISLANFRTHAVPWLPTMLYPPGPLMSGDGVWKGEIWAAIPSGGSDIDVWYQES